MPGLRRADGLGIFMNIARRNPLGAKPVSMSPRKTLALILSGSRNVRFDDFVRLVRAFGFGPPRINGSHHIFSRPGITEAINVQDYHGQAKPYQIRQFLKVVEKYGLTLEEQP